MVTLADNRPIVASLSRSGWYAAWWPDATASTKVTGYDGVGTRDRHRRNDRGHAAADPPRHDDPDRRRPRRQSLEFRGDRVVGEEPLEIRAAGPGQDPVAVAVTMRTPGFEDELAIGLPADRGPDRRARRSSGSSPATPPR